MNGVLEARSVGYTVGGTSLLHGVDLRLDPGQLLAIAGPNGAGKSTLLGLLAGDLPASAGEVVLDGRPLQSYKSRQLALRRAVLPQKTVLQFAFTAEEVVALGRSPHRSRFGGHDADGDAAVRDALRRVDAAGFADRSFPSLSAGEQARVSLARVLAQQTKILLLDEPTAALDLRHQQLVMTLARELASVGVAVAVVVHDLNLAARHADVVALLKDGHRVAVGEPWEVLTEPMVSEVFDQRVRVLPHPDCNRPLLVTAG